MSSVVLLLCQDLDPSPVQTQPTCLPASTEAVHFFALRLLGVVLNVICFVQLCPDQLTLPTEASGSTLISDYSGGMPLAPNEPLQSLSAKVFDEQIKQEPLTLDAGVMEVGGRRVYRM